MITFTTSPGHKVNITSVVLYTFHFFSLRQAPSPPANLYTTSIHTLVSSNMKLARITKIPDGRKVFRGLGRMKLGPEWFQNDERGSRCAVELGFMSTTQNRHIALEYSGVNSGGAGAIFEFDVGSVDIGAKLDSISQYPGICRLQIME